MWLENMKINRHVSQLRHFWKQVGQTSPKHMGTVLSVRYLKSRDELHSTSHVHQGSQCDWNWHTDFQQLHDAECIEIQQVQICVGRLNANLNGVIFSQSAKYSQMSWDLIMFKNLDQIMKAPDFTGIGVDASSLKISLILLLTYLE